MRLGLDGLLCLVGVPGTIGGAVRMNAGTAHGWIGERVREVRGYTAGGEPFTFGAEACGFDYRTSRLAGTFVTQVVLELTPTDEELGRSTEAVFGPEGIKAGHTSGGPREAILSVARALVERGAEAIVAGCPAIPLVLRPEDISVPLIEPMRIAAEACILKAGYRIRTEGP